MTAPRPELSPTAVDVLLAQLERAIGRDLFQALRSLRDLVALPTLTAILLRRSIKDAVDHVPWPVLQNALARAQQRLGQVREIGWRGALQPLPAKILKLPPLRLELGAYAQQRPAVLEALQRQDLSRITAITEESRDAVRELLGEGLRTGRMPADLARDLREVIGLNRPQARALLKFRAQLERAGRTPDQVERMVARRARQMLTQRAETIAATETIRALNEGKLLQWERLVAEGHLNPADWELEWVSAGTHEQRVCPICRAFHGVRTRIGQPFTSRTGVVLRGPGAHSRCRCTVRLVLRGFRKGEPPAPARDRILQGLR